MKDEQEIYDYLIIPFKNPGKNISKLTSRAQINSNI